MCIASFNFNLNGVEVESIISKQFSVLSALLVSSLTRCAKMWGFYQFANAPSSLLINGELSYQCNRHYSLDKQTYKQQSIPESLELDLSR